MTFLTLNRLGLLLSAELKHFQTIGNNRSNVIIKVGLKPETWSSCSLVKRFQMSNAKAKEPQLEELLAKKNISRAMKGYLERAVAHDKFMSEKVTEYEIGKRHLANMMGEDPETFTQDDIDEAIAYLFPSGLYEPKARPMFKHPSEIYSARKAAEFDYTGRPFSCFFYTGWPKFFSLAQQISNKVLYLNSLINKSSKEIVTKTLDLEDSEWISKEKLEEMLEETIRDKFFSHFITFMEQLKNHPLMEREIDFIMSFRNKKRGLVKAEEIRELMYTREGVPYMTISGVRRKTAFADVTVRGFGSGKFTVNGNDILYFEKRQDREQIMFPLQLVGLLTEVDVEATVKGGGPSGQAGAIRYATAMALRSFVSPQMVIRMTVAGLLTRDMRNRLRKKPGQPGARRQRTWRKR